MPYGTSDFRKDEGYHCQGGHDYTFLYHQSVDSLLVYIPNKEPMYHVITAVQASIPVRAISLPERRLDSLKQETRYQQVKAFAWK